jgi:GTP-binding protein
MPQTRVVLRQALLLGLRPVIVINKLDRTNADPNVALEATHDLLLELATDAAQLDAPVIFATGRAGTASTSLNVPGVNLEPLLDAIVAHVPAPRGDPSLSLQLLVSSLDDDPYRGRLALGRVQRGTLTRGQEVVVASADGWSGRQAITGILVWRGLHQIEVPEARVGDIVAVFGLSEVNIGDSICAADSPEALPRIEVGDPTLRMQFTVNTSPFAGREQKLSSTSRQLRARLDKELRTNVALRVADGATADGFEVSGRGELHLAILIETMRREGYEFEVSRPQVITKEKNGTKLEPVEECVIDVQQSYLGAVTELLGARGAVMQSLRTDAGGGMRLIYHAPTRALIGVRSTLLTLTRGTGVMATRLLGWEPWRFLPRAHRMGVLTASQPGMAVAYGLLTLQERGQPLIGPGTPVYEGMVVGMNRRPGDLAVNVAKQKQKTNIRSSTSDFTVTLTPPRTLSLEEALDFIQDDELVEVTPSSLRLRKRVLNANDRNAIRKREALRT